jgi:pilus assembly protein CpaF
MWKIKHSANTTPEIPTEVAPIDMVVTAPVLVEPNDRSIDLKVELHRKVIDMINLSVLDELSREQIEAEIGAILNEELALRKQVLNTAERKKLASDVVDELLGLGPLEPLLKDDSISDILVNGAGKVFVERKGLLVLTATRFKDDAHLLRVIQKIVSFAGRRIDESAPLVDARLPDGSRVNAVIPPLALDGPLLSIRKFAKVPIDMDRLVEIGSLPRQVAELLRIAVQIRRNIIISGGTGSGKTTMLNALSAAIGAHERIVTIEDSAELQLQQEHVARLETRPASIEGTGEITQRDLVKNALRMRPDRIILGEVRAGEAFDMLQAMNTGHDGSMTTVHANSPRDTLSRIEQMIGMSGIDIPARSARAQIASAIHLIVQIGRLGDGRRRLLSVAEIAGMEGEVITMQEIVRFRQTGRSSDGEVIGHFETTGVRPRLADEAKAYGLDVPVELFRSESRLDHAA